MISMLQGTVFSIEGAIVTLDVGGVGYEVQCSRACVASLGRGETATLVISTQVKEDSIKLYGFADRLEKRVFHMLTLVKGVGARSASEIISQIDKDFNLNITISFLSHDLNYIFPIFIFL